MTIYEGDTALLGKLQPRKEMRLTRDLVRLSSEQVDDRALALDAPWFSTEDGADDVDEDEDEASELESETKAEQIGSGADGGDSEDDAAADDAGLGDEVDSDEDEECEVPQSSFARKRKRPQSPLPPSSLTPSSKSQSGPMLPRKKVAFAIPVKATTNSTRPSSSSSKDHTLSKTRPSPPYKKSDVDPKAPVGTKAPPPSRTRKSAANAPPPTAQKRKPEAGGGKDGAYDFSKFF